MKRLSIEHKVDHKSVGNASGGHGANAHVYVNVLWTKPAQIEGTYYPESVVSVDVSYNKGHSKPLLEITLGEVDVELSPATIKQLEKIIELQKVRYRTRTSMR